MDLRVNYYYLFLKTPSQPINIISFTVVHLKHRSDRNTWHQLFVKEHKHKPANDRFPDGKTLCVLNVPPYVNKEHLEFGYRLAGAVDEIIFSIVPEIKEVQPSSDSHFNYFPGPNPCMDKFKCAFVTFKTSKALRKALAQDEVQLYENNKTILRTGLAKWMTEFLDHHVNETELQKEVEGYLEIFDETERQTKEAEQQEQPPDDDGWTVVKKGKHGGFAQSERILSRLNAKIESGQQKKELKNFYRFQKQHAKQAEVGKLRRRFAADRAALDERKLAKRMKK